MGLGDIRHLRTFGHWPTWVRFDAFAVCERCLRPPRRPNVPRAARRAILVGL